ncbi:hypothetical protein ABT112_22735 [Streptomyces sp. NPDC002055]|uniref:hypothetical protein n=1 Tax=Streptomyces sp. NPDC002055 TaxID=3154534 RepID=UPI00332AF1A3
MTKLLLSVHVLAAILTVGSIAVAASLFPRYALQASGGADPDGRAAGVAALLHRICRGYALAGLAVPVFGIATGARLGVLTDAWLIASLVLTTLAAGLLALAILPGQRRLLAAPRTPDADVDGDVKAEADVEVGAEAESEQKTAPDELRPVATRLTMLTGVFNLLWAIVVILMIIRPGSTTGA